MPSLSCDHSCQLYAIMSGCLLLPHRLCLGADQVPIPDHMDLYHLHQEAEPSDRTALQAVVDHIEAEVARLNALEEHIMCEFGPEDERLQVNTSSVLCVALSNMLCSQFHWLHREFHRQELAVVPQRGITRSFCCMGNQQRPRACRILLSLFCSGLAWVLLELLGL